MVVADCDVDVFASPVLTGSCSFALIDCVSSQQPALLCLTRSTWGGFAYSLNEMSMKMRRGPSLILADIGSFGKMRRSMLHYNTGEWKYHPLG